MITKGYIYVRNHPEYERLGARKLGKASNIPDRDSQYATGEIIRGYFELVIEVPIEKMDNTERSIQKHFKHLNIKYDGGTEFYNKTIITLIEPYLDTIGLIYKKLSDQEVKDLTRCNRVKKTFKKINIKELINALRKPANNNQAHIWREREYQRKIINYCKRELFINNKIYIELPTGGGKSYIVYNLLNYLNSNFIVIISPRKIINSQNISQKYLQLLSNQYTVFDFSKDTNIDSFLQNNNPRILICCTQSMSKVCEKITDSNIKDIAIWFDEAHWGIEDRTDKLKNSNEESDSSSEYWLLNTTTIKYRIFTSASPNKQKILEYENIFGKVCSAITVKELIELKWLSPMNVYVYSDNITNVDNTKYIINDFIEKKRKFGFSFHNKQKNAFKLFYMHYIQYKNGDNHIRPYLLVSDNFTEIKEPLLSDITLDYNYRDIKDYENNEYSIGYVVAKYSMGYDFNKIDFICISDPKLSIKDIIQCIGRGIRPDQLGEYGTNRDKIIIISLPVYIDETENNKYQTIIEVLKYLLHTIEISYEEINFIERSPTTIKNSNSSSDNDYSGINVIKSLLLDLLKIDKANINSRISFDKIKKIVSDNNIRNKSEYYELCNKNDALPREPDITFKGKFKGWIDYLSIPTMFYDIDICKNKIAHYLEIYPEIKKDHLDMQEVCKKLCNIDSLFPPYDLWVEYYNIKSLGEIITIKSNKKMRGVVL